MSIGEVVVKKLLIHLIEKFLGYVVARCIADYGVRVTFRAKGRLSTVDIIDNLACRENRAATEAAALTRCLNLSTMQRTVFMNRF